MAPVPRPQLAFLLRRLEASLVPRPGRAPSMPCDPQALGQAPSVSWIGHSTLYLRLGRLGLLTDPVYSERASPVPFVGPRRLLPPGIPLAALPSVDVVLLSHDHYDHADLRTMRALAARGAHFLVPTGMGDLVRRVGGDFSELAWWQAATIGGARVHCVPARHFSGRGLGDRNRRLWCGFVIEAERRVYFAGDTGYSSELLEITRRLGPIDLACLPIGAYLPRSMMGPIHLDPEEAVRLALGLEARQTLGMHWGTFDLADEPIGEPPRRFLAEAARRGLEGRAFVMKVGETRRF